MPSAPRHPVFRRICTVLIILYVLFIVVAGIGLAEIALHPGSHAVTPGEERNARAAAEADSEHFEDVELHTPDGATLRAWFLSPQDSNGNAVLLLHGVGDNRVGLYGFGKWLLENHYAVLLPDSRAHSHSTGLATYGLNESNDIHLWVDWLEQNAHPHCVFGLGESMGAAQLLQSLPKEPRFCAVIAESPFASFREVAYNRMGQPFGIGPWLGKTLLRPAIEVGFLYLRLRYKLNMNHASPEQAVEQTSIPILLIHGLADDNIPPYHSDLIQAHHPNIIEVWKVPGALHTQAHKAAPEQYDQKVLTWFATHPNPPPTQTR